MNKKEWSIVCTVQTWAVVVRKLDKTNKYSRDIKREKTTDEK
jgi:hypothetical protein